MFTGNVEVLKKIDFKVFIKLLRLSSDTFFLKNIRKHLRQNIMQQNKKVQFTNRLKHVVLIV